MTEKERERVTKRERERKTDRERQEERDSEKQRGRKKINSKIKLIKIKNGNRVKRRVIR